MARKTKMNHISSPELIEQFNEQNKFLISSFLDYLVSVDRAKSTIEQYKNDLNIFFCWNVTDNNNKPFIKITKREFTKFQGKALTDWEWSPNRLRRVKSVISSLSNYIENILDEEEEFEGYRSVIKKIESPPKTLVREKTVFETEELQKLLDHLVSEKKYKQACALSLAMCSARRKAELPRFKVSYFDQENVLFGSLYKTPEKVKTKGATTKGKMIELYILKKEFDPYLKLWMDERKEKGIESIWLFPKTTNPNEPISTDTLDNWADYFTKVLNKDFYWHSIRHYATTQYVKQNVPPSAIKEIIGWNSVEMVDTYTDIPADNMLEKYFDENGVKADLKPTAISEM